jgi:hypothetical protein
MRIARGLLATLVLVGACTTLTTGSDYDRAADFSAYRSYAWLPRAHAHVQNPLNVRRVEEAIQAELEAKGLKLEPDRAHADLTVDFTLGSRERIDVTSYPVEYRGPWGWGMPYFGSEVDVHQYREGTLAIDIFDAKSHRPVWHGWAKKPLAKADLENPGPSLRAAVAAVLARFPPAPAAAR